MSYQHTSGATKRKKKREEMLSLRKHPKIDQFCNPAPTLSQSASAEVKSRPSHDDCNAEDRTSDTSCVTVTEGNGETQPSISEGCSTSSTVTNSVEASDHPNSTETKHVETANKLDVID